MFQIFEDVLTAEHCQMVISIYQSGMVRRNSNQYGVVDFIPVVSHINQTLMENCRDAMVDVLARIPDQFMVQRANLEFRSDGMGMDFHTDMTNSKTYFTSVLYLNHDYDGGETVIRPHGEVSNAFDLTIKPRTGRMVLFDGAGCLHRVNPIKGQRYTLPVWYMPAIPDYPTARKWWMAR